MTEKQPEVTTGTYSLPEAALILCGSNGDNEQRWVANQLRSGGMNGYKAQRRWRMTQSDLDAAIAGLRPKPQVPSFTSMTARSQRRVSA